MHWKTKGPTNTDATVNVAVEAARQRGIRHLVVASNTGATVQRMLQHDVQGLNIVCVTHHVGFRKPGEIEMTPENREELAGQGVQMLTTTHVLAGVDRAARFKFGGMYPPEIMAETLRMFGQGVKVGVEIGIMALDAGMIPYGEDVIAVGGSGTGADAACVIRPAHSTAAFDVKVMDILCRPTPAVE